jgi:hypothetical protein
MLTFRVSVSEVRVEVLLRILRIDPRPFVTPYIGLSVASPLPAIDRRIGSTFDRPGQVLGTNWRPTVLRGWQITI